MKKMIMLCVFVLASSGVFARECETDVISFHRTERAFESSYLFDVVAIPNQRDGRTYQIAIKPKREKVFISAVTIVLSTLGRHGIWEDKKHDLLGTAGNYGRLKDAFVWHSNRIVFSGNRYYYGFRRRLWDGGQAVSFYSLFNTSGYVHSVEDNGRSVATYDFGDMRLEIRHCTYSDDEIRKVSSINGDMNGDGKVDFADFIIFANAFGNQ